MGFRTVPMSSLAGACEAPDRETLFTPELRAEIDAWCAKYPPEWRQSAVIPALHILQAANGGWLAQQQLDDLALYLGMPPIAVYEVASFYSMFDLEPVGRHKVCVCNSVSCLLGGSEALIHHIEQKYGVGPGETTPDGRFTFKEVECLGACKDAPAVLIGRTYHEKVSPQALDKLIGDLE
jgi:NADH-quinone oxidoreductase subunit E